MPVLSMIIPIYFNSESLPLLFERISTVEDEFRKRGVSLELIFVDDGSKDDSLEQLLIIKSKRPSTKVIKLTRNFEAVHASKTGLWFATGDCFVILAADLQDPPELLIEMVDLWLDGHRFVVASRANRKDPPISEFFARAYYRLLRSYIAPNYPDGGFDIAVMDKSLLSHFVASSKNTYSPLLAHWLGFEPVVIKYDRPGRLHGKSRWTFGKKFNSAMDALLGFSVLPIRMISLCRFIIALFSFGYGSWIFGNALLGNVEVKGFRYYCSPTGFFQWDAFTNPRNVRRIHLAYF